MSFQGAQWIWKNGELVSWENATVHVSAHALHYGSGVFEGIRCYETDFGPAVFRLDEHLDRLFKSAAVYGIRIPYTLDALQDATLAVINANGFRACYVRPICYFGSASLGLNPRNCPVEVAILAWTWPAYVGSE